MQKLPEAEFEVMKALWALPAPATSSMLMQTLDGGKRWTLSTLASLLSRLEKRGFVRSEKQGKERQYYCEMDRERYLAFETSAFISQYHGNSLVQFVDTLDKNRSLSNEDLDAVQRWLDERKA